MTQRFEKAYNALYNAFMNDTLAKGSCAACAVGNIVADAMGGHVYNDGPGFYTCTVNNRWWGQMFMTGMRGQIIYENEVAYEFRDRILELTGYRWDEMAKIEKAFENNTKIEGEDYNEFSEKEIMEDQFNGLMAVMDVLIGLDNIEEGNKCKETFRNKFATL